jgi:hypothetical protein
MASLRRSTRTVQQVSYSEEAFGSSYPDGPPINDFEESISRLNLDAFDSEIFAMVDDIVVYSLYGAKRRNHRSSAWAPSRAFKSDDGERPMSTSDALKFRDLCSTHPPGDQSSDRLAAIQTIVSAILNAFPAIFQQEHVYVLSQ